MGRAFAAIVLLAGLVVALGVAPSSANDAKPVVELFTSQGCASCPPADALLVELAARGDVIALSEHVDYWNYIGWTDPFSDAGGTERQRAYRRALGLPYVYTPQMVIDGAAEAVGSERSSVEARIAAARAAPHIAIETIRDGDATRVRIPAGQDVAKGAIVWMIDYDRRHTTEIARGENSGVTLVNANVVRKMRKAATYDGAALEFKVDPAKLRDAGRSGCTILVQAADGGRIFGAIAIDADQGS